MLNRERAYKSFTPKEGSTGERTEENLRYIHKHIPYELNGTMISGLPMVY